MYVVFVFLITNSEEGGTLIQDRLHEIRPGSKMPGNPADLEKMIRGCSGYSTDLDFAFLLI
jgi:hypothetical protein